MDFRLTRTAFMFFVGAGTAMLLAGCSSSMGYVDYASIPGPPDGQKSDAETGNKAASDSTTQQTNQQPDASANTTSVQPSDIQADVADESASDIQESQEDADVSQDADGTETPAAEDPPVADNSDNEAGASGNTAQDTAATEANTRETVIGAAGDAAGTGEEEAVAPLEIKLLIPEKRFRTEGDAAALRLTYDDIDLLKILNMQPVPTDAPRHFPAWLSDLDGKRIRIRGFMYPTFEAEGIDYFRLARDNGICCFVKQPKIYDIIDVIMAEGKTTDYIENKPFDVEGVFRIIPEADETELFQLYRIEDATVLR